MPESRTVALVTLGCARNEVDSEELAGRLEADGWQLVDDAGEADVAVVNTCGFVEAAKKDSVDALLEANDLKGHGRTQAVVAVGCMAERYGKELAEALPEADGVLGFDDYTDISDRLQTILNGGIHAAHTPRDRRKLLPISPAERQEAGASVAPAGARPDRPARGRRPRLRPPRAPAPSPRRLPGRLREAGLRLRPALLLLRHPVLPRLLHLPPPERRAERDAVAGGTGRQGDHAGLREQHLLRQGPRRHPPAGVAAAEPRRRRRHRARARQLPPAGRDAPRPHRRTDLHPEGHALLRPVLPALRAERAPRDAPLRRHRPLPGAA